MEFLATPPHVAPKALYPCLASITIAPASAGTGNIVGSNDRSRRLSTGSAGAAASGDEEEGTLKRIISGGRRKSSFGAVANAGSGDAAERRKSIAPSHAHHAHGIVGGNATGQSASGPEGVEKGTWYWRVQAGVSGNNLILLPLSQPPNSLLTSPPQPLSAAMPSHNKEHSHEDEGLVDKVKNLFRRGSSHPEGHAHGHNKETQAQGGDDKIIDQTPQGGQLPPSGVASAGGGGVDETAESGWPGTVDGGKLQAVVVTLSQVDKNKVAISGGKRGEASWVTVPINSHFASMTLGHNDGGAVAKSGVIKLEFDKDWIGSKGEAELLHHHITSALTSDRSPKPQQLQLGGGITGSGQTGAGGGNTVSSNYGLGGTGTNQVQRQDDVAPDAQVPFNSGDGSGIAGVPGIGPGSGIGTATGRGFEANESVASSRKVPGEA